ncbi:Glycoside hydrolase, family 28 [Pleurostoma richardsiae]|uniref:endo-polygalacturonase n=1 Tax=Pleurostoma richardsiae TaxID=41990 RepID=A0AA38VRI7_9PEZI|nr:Glycoside hydrolase, family 28 [Pleurostoma richardsiae]
MKLSLLTTAALASCALACSNPDSDPCAGAFVTSSAQIAGFCATYTKSVVTETTGFPTPFASICGYKSKKFSSACSCYITGGSAASSTPAATPTTTTAQATTLSTSVVKVATTTSPTKTISTVAAVGNGGTTCTVTAYASISSAVNSCSNIILSNISAPPSSTIDLQKLQTGAAVIFAGTTSFGTTADDDFDPIVISGTDITITGAAGHVIDGNGQAYWDGEGSNGGGAKPDHFIVVKKTVNAKITNLNIQNWPVHCFQITSSQDLTISGLTLDNSAGDAANSKSDGDPAAHNSDGFDISSCDGVTLDSISVHNQDDCVAVTSGSRITVNNLYCYGGHGLSIGSVGGKSNNTVAGVTFSNSQVVDSQNGCRIKTNSGTTGAISDVTYQNITLSGITDYGIDVQQDYLNGGPTGDPTNGVTIAGVHFVDVTGTATGSSAYNYYILCGDGSCSDFTYSGVSITGGGKGGSCNFPSSGCPS